MEKELEELSRLVGRLAHELGYRAYLVGGPVRDLLLSRESWDADYAVEGNALKLAERLSKELGVELHPFEPFMTAHLKVGKLKVELATARREHYERPGAYPRVEPATLNEDLKRRDFTVNAMALSVNPDDYGRLIDPLKGREDLRKGLLRVLKPGSFKEDPVRMLRALRFAARFNFKLEPFTERELLSASREGYLKLAPRPRLLNELKLALREENAPLVLELYQRYGLLGQLLGVDFNEELYRVKEAMPLVRRLLPEGQEGWLYLVFLLKSAPDAALLKEMGAPAWAAEAHRFLKEEFGPLSERLKAARDAGSIYELLRPLRPHQLALLAPFYVPKVELFLEKLRPFKLPPEELERLKRSGLKGRELGRAVEERKKELLTELFKDLKFK
ncbi:MAG: CCA tRNA nucleotidyltransferase [Aquificae bacterium]|nr:CCA tRNA nucleotidyltransferase [Aquificota bacterium]